MLSKSIWATKYSRGMFSNFFNLSYFEYHKRVVEHYENPKNVGSLDKQQKDVGTGLVGAPACGDVMKLQIKVGDDGIIQDAKFKVSKNC